MRLMNINTARVIWIMNIRDMNPSGLNIGKALQWIGTKYNFEKYPTVNLLEDPSRGYVYTAGTFSVSSDSTRDIYVDLVIYDGGLVATTRSSTVDTEAFLLDAVTSLAKEFNLAFRPEMIRQTMYLSELDVVFDKPLSLLNPHLENFAKKVSELQGGNPSISYHFSTISFQPDPTVQTWRPSPFHIERRLEVPFTENRYYSAAPMQTNHHLDLLKAFENIVLAG